LLCRERALLRFSNANEGGGHEIQYIPEIT
jgi:hypothetical protein